MKFETPKIPKVPTYRTVKDDVIQEAIRPLVGDFRRKTIDIDSYRSKFLNGHARAYLFLCSVQFPGIQNAIKSGLSTALSNPTPENIGKMVKDGLVAGGNTAIKVGRMAQGTEDFKYYVKASSLPESSLEETSTYFCGHQYKISSVRRTQDWTVSFYINNDASIVRKFWDWHQIMHNPETGVYGSPIDYMSDQTIQLIGADGSNICTYKLYSAWPKTLGQIDLDYATNDFATMDVTFSYQYHTVTKEKEIEALTYGRKLAQSLGSTALGGG